ncbi:MAG: ATP-binding protein [Lachnospiraceae bacterium]|nr:ATP-binding protein [Lachnospiraceae bacterium]
MKGKMNFKRDFVYQLKETLNTRDVVFLLGPRKCGKTIGLLQIKEDGSDNEIKYYDFKTLKDNESMDLINAICKDILLGTKVTYLLDEATYIYFAEEEISKIAEARSKAKVDGTAGNTKLVFTGSQSIALRAWGMRAFGNQALYFETSFLTYPEWLRFKNIQEKSEQSYCDFIQGTKEFYDDFESVEAYLEACLAETVYSNARSRNAIYGNDCDLTDASILLDVLYSTMFTLHDTSSVNNFFSSKHFEERLKYIIKQLDISDMDPFLEKYTQSFIYKYDSVCRLDIDALKQAYAFLIRCGLITATPIFSEFEQQIDVLKQLETPNTIFKRNGDILGKVNFTINYPMFYVEVIKDILQENLPHDLPGYLLGSIVECHVRGLLDSNGAYEFHEQEGMEREIDYVNDRKKMAVEITISNKNVQKNVHLNMIEDYKGYDKILLSKNINDVVDGIKRIPYYEFIYDLSDKKQSNRK